MVRKRGSAITMRWAKPKDREKLPGEWRSWFRPGRTYLALDAEGKPIAQAAFLEDALDGIEVAAEQRARLSRDFFRRAMAANFRRHGEDRIHVFVDPDAPRRDALVRLYRQMGGEELRPVFGMPHLVFRRGSFINKSKD